MLSLHKLEVFIAVAQDGKISRAAERLFMTQAAVSQHIHDLEASLGVSLFARHSQGVNLTSAGQTLLGYAQNIIGTIAAAENALTNVENLKAGKLEIGMTPTAASFLLSDWLGGFRDHFPSIKVSVQTNITPVLEQALLEKQIDMAFVEGEVEKTARMQVVELLETKILVAVGTTHPWAGRSSISIRELAEAPYLSRQDNSHTHNWTMGLFSKFGLTPNIVAEFDNPHDIQRAILQGIGVSLMPACLVCGDEIEERLRLLPVAELPDLRRSLKAIWLNDLPLKPIPRAFLDLLAQRYPQLHIPDTREALPNAKLDQGVAA
jgi:DNA-binding transcriptional LysR family regulator